MPYLSLTLKDSYQRTTKKLYELEEQVDLATYASVVAGFVTDLLAVTELGLVRADIILPAGIAATSPGANSNIDAGATISGYTSKGNGAKAVVKVPGPEVTYIQPDGTLDLADTDLAAFLDNFEDAGAFTISDGEYVTSWIKGWLDK